MLMLKEFMETVDYRITEGSEYGWQCFGPNAYQLDSWIWWNQVGHSFSVIFDTKTQSVYQVEAHDFKNNRAYRMINPEFRDAYNDEADSRGVDRNTAWDDVAFVDLDSTDDFIQKALAIKAGEVYDTRVNVPLDLEDKLLFELMKLAHEGDITLNRLVEQILRDAIDGDDDVIT